MSDDSVTRLQQLAALHSQGDLTDAEFASAKASVLSEGRATAPAPQPATAPAPAEVMIARAGAPSDGRSSVARRVRHDHEKGLWRQGWVMIVAGFLGFMYATVGTAVVHGSALWTGRLLCGNGFQLAANVSSYSYGTTSGESVSYACVAGHVVHSASTGAILGLQLLLGTAVSYALILLIGGIRRVTGRA